MSTQPAISLTAPAVRQFDQLRLGGGIALAVALFAGGAFWASGGLPARAMMAAGATLALVIVLLTLRALIAKRARDQVSTLLARFIDKDAAPSFVTDSEGGIVARNIAAGARFGAEDNETLAGALRAVFANPVAVLYRLQSRARLDGAAREDVVTRFGHIRLAVHMMGDNQFLWRVEDIRERQGMGRPSDSLPLAMVSVGRSGAVLFMNEVARQMVGSRVRTLDRLFVNLPLRPGATNILCTADGPVEVILAEQDSTAGRRELFFLPLDKAAGDGRSEFVETLPVAMLKVAFDGEILTANAQAHRLIGRESLPGQRLGEVMQGLGRPLVDWLREAATGSAARQSQFLRLAREDKEVFVQVTLNPVTEAGEPRLIAVLNDATELKTLEAQFVQSQKMQAIGQLAGGVAHDFNNLLTAISGHCDLLLLRHDRGDQDYGDLIQINENSNRAAALVGQLLAFSRKQTLRPEVLDLRDTLSDLTHLLNRLVGEKVTLTLSHDPVLRAIHADKRQLEQVIMNLVVNARDAMPAGGEIRIETELVHFSKPLERDRAVVPAGDYVCVRVCDQGGGIPSDKLQKVFEPFYTTKRTGEGTGLGLSTAYGIIKQTGGFIFVDSNPGHGTIFTLYLPAHLEPSSQPQTRPQAATPAVATHGEGVVLLVEDEAPVRGFASRALRLRGYTVIEAESAEDALELLEDPTLNVDVFVTDVVMPGMDGPSWVREALKTRPDVRVIFVSGYAEGAFGDHQPPVANAVFLPKPFSLNQLTQTVHQQMY